MYFDKDNRIDINYMLLIDRNVVDISQCLFESQSKGFFFLVETSYVNTKTGPLTKEHNSYPWKF
jgi:hypothetical protein